MELYWKARLRVFFSLLLLSIGYGQAIDQGPGDPNSEVYLLITNSKLADDFNSLKEWRIDQGMTGFLEKIEDIEAHYQGIDTQEKIRNCVKDYYQNYCDPNTTMYLTLGGDQFVIPVRYCYPWVDANDTNEVPADLYYSDIDGGSWDTDGDGRYGEPEDITVDSLIPEICLGRIPAGTVAEVQGYVQKVQTYELTSPEDFANPMLIFAGSSDVNDMRSGSLRPEEFRHHDPVSRIEIQRTRDYLTYIQPYWQATPIHLFFDTISPWDTERCGDFDLTTPHALERLNSGEYNFVYHIGHAHSRSIGIGREGNSITSDDASSLTNSIPFIFISASCSSAGFDLSPTPCVSQGFLLNPNGGAVAYYGHTRSSSGNEPRYHLFTNIFSGQNRRIGLSYRQAKEWFALNIYNPSKLYKTVLQGDPALKLHLEEATRDLQIFSPKGCEEVELGDTLYIRWNASGTDFQEDEKVKLEYSNDSGQSWQIISGAEALNYNGMVFAWSTEDLQGGDRYRVRVVSLTTPSLISDSNDFMITQMVRIDISSQPIIIVPIDGSHCNETPYDISVPIGGLAEFIAPPLSDHAFTRWRDGEGQTLSESETLIKVFTSDLHIIAEYSYLGEEVDFYISPDGVDANDGLSMSSPMRTIENLMKKYPWIGPEDTIHLLEGTHRIVDFVINANNSGLTVKGKGRGKTIIDGCQSGRFLSIVDDANVSISDLTIQNCNVQEEEGGAISVKDAQIYVVNCDFLGNCGMNAGSVLLWKKARARFVNCRFYENEALSQGGVFLIRGTSQAEITNCIFCKNQLHGRNGGAIHGKDDSYSVIKGCIFENNESQRKGGALFFADSAQAVIQACSITCNKSRTEYGGGVAIMNSSKVTIVDSEISRNVAWRNGGGIYSIGQEMLIKKCLIAGNSARINGGGVYFAHLGISEMNNCTVYGNKAGTYGGAICYDVNHCGSVSNSIVRQNSAEINGTEVCLLNDSNLTISFSNIDPSPNNIYVDNSIFYWKMGNISKDPLFVKPGYWDPNETPDDASDDFWVHGDYHLKSEAGRWDPNLYRSSDFTSDGILNFIDFAHFANSWLLTDQNSSADLNRDGSVDVEDLSIFSDRFLTPGGTGGWIIDSITSHCIDVGNPGCPLGDEPNHPDNVRINMGAYGGTAEASMSPHDWAFLADVTNDGLVDFRDYAAQAMDWLNQTDWQPGDFNRDSLIDTSDLALLTEDWLKTTTWHQ